MTKVTDKDGNRASEVKVSSVFKVSTDTISSVTLASGPTKTKYLSSESIDYSGIKLKITYKNTGSTTINGTSYVTGYTTNTNIRN